MTINLKNTPKRFNDTSDAKNTATFAKKFDKHKQKKTPKKITQSYLHNSGLYYLQRYASSTQRFREVMQRKIYKSCQAHDEQNINDCHDLLETVINVFQKSGLLNDRIYTEGRVKTLRRKGKSRQFIMTDLNTKGVASDLVDTIIKDIDTNYNDCTESAEISAAILYAQKKRLGRFRTSILQKNVDPLEQQKKDLARMARAGFSYSVSHMVICDTEKDTH